MTQQRRIKVRVEHERARLTDAHESLAVEQDAPASRKPLEQLRVDVAPKERGDLEPVDPPQPRLRHLVAPPRLTAREARVRRAVASTPGPTRATANATTNATPTPGSGAPMRPCGGCRPPSQRDQPITVARSARRSDSSKYARATSTSSEMP